MPNFAAARTWLLVSLSLSLLLTDRVAGAVPETDCGSTRLVKVRFPDGSPVPGLQVALARSVFSVDHGSDTSSSTGEAPPGSATEQSAPFSLLTLTLTVAPTWDVPQSDCMSASEGSVRGLTNADGIAGFAGLAEGSWMLHFEGTVSRGGQAGRAMPVTPASLQGMYPYGRTRSGGGFVELVSPLNEEGYPNGAPVSPSTGDSTSRYVLQLNKEGTAWMPGLDLATGDEEGPLPLAEVTPFTSTTANLEYDLHAATPTILLPFVVSLSDAPGAASSPRKEPAMSGERSALKSFLPVWLGWLASITLALGGITVVIQVTKTTRSKYRAMHRATRPRFVMAKERVSGDNASRAVTRNQVATADRSYVETYESASKCENRPVLIDVQQRDL